MKRLTIIAIFAAGGLFGAALFYTILAWGYDYREPTTRTHVPKSNLSHEAMLALLQPEMDSVKVLSVDYRSLSKQQGVFTPDLPLQVISVLDSVSPDRNQNRMLCYQAFTDSLYFTDQDPAMFNDETKIISIIRWSESLRALGNIPVADYKTLSYIGDYWLGRIADTINQYGESSSHLRHSTGFKYIAGRLAENGYLITLTEPKVTKGMEHLMASNYSYLWNRILLATDWKFKAVVAIAGLVILLSLIYSLINLTRRTKGRS